MIVDEIFKSYRRAGGKVDLSTFTDYFEKFEEMNCSAITGDMDPDESPWHKEVYEEAEKTGERYLDVTMRRYAKYVGSKAEANRIFKAVDSVIACS